MYLSLFVPVVSSITATAAFVVGRKIERIYLQSEKRAQKFILGILADGQPRTYEMLERNAFIGGITQLSYNRALTHLQDAGLVIWLGIQRSSGLDKPLVQLRSAWERDLPLQLNRISRAVANAQREAA